MTFENATGGWQSRPWRSLRTVLVAGISGITFLAIRFVNNEHSLFALEADKLPARAFVIQRERAVGIRAAAREGDVRSFIEQIGFCAVSAERAAILKEQRSSVDSVKLFHVTAVRARSSYGCGCGLFRVAKRGGLHGDE